MTSFIPPVTVLTPIVIRILGCNPGAMTLQGTNTYLLGSGRKRILFDTGQGVPEYFNNLKSVLSSENVTLEHIIISHWHIDHIGGIKSIMNSSFSANCKVWKYARSDCSELDYVNDVLINKLQNNQEFFTEGATLKVIHTPGHSTDHIILTLKEENAVFSGDCILGEGTSIFEDLHEYLNSLHKIQDLKAKIIYPGHGPINVEETVKRYIQHRLEREKNILVVIDSFPVDKEWTVDELVEILYKETPRELHKAAGWNVSRHLHKLLKDDKVTLTNDKWKIRSNL
ncbi:hypothetical protein PGB90_006017 [Kerria lacca]